MYLFNSSTTIIPQYITVLVDHSFSLFLGHLDKSMLLILPPSPCFGWFESCWLNTEQGMSKILLCLLHSMTSRKQEPSISITALKYMHRAYLEPIKSLMQNLHFEYTQGQPTLCLQYRCQPTMGGKHCSSVAMSILLFEVFWYDYLIDYDL